MKHLVGTRGVLVKSNDSNLVHSCVYYCKYKWGKFVCKDYSLIFLLDPQEKHFSREKPNFVTYNACSIYLCSIFLTMEKRIPKSEVK